MTLKLFLKLLKLSSSFPKTLFKFFLNFPEGFHVLTVIFAFVFSLSSPSVRENGFVSVSQRSLAGGFCSLPALPKKNGFIGWMLETLSISNMLIDSGSLQDRLLMEHIPGGIEYFSTIARAMKINHKLRISYRKFGQESPYTVEVAPYAIKIGRAHV